MKGREKMTFKERVKVLRKEIKKRVPTVSVKMARGTAYGWVEIWGSGPEYGEFTGAELDGMESMGMGRNLGNCRVIQPTMIQTWINRLTS